MTADSYHFTDCALEVTGWSGDGRTLELTISQPPADDDRSWLPYCGNDGRPPAGTGGRKVWIIGRTGVPLPSRGDLADWRFVKMWCFRT